LRKPWRQVAGGHWAAILATLSLRRACRSESTRPGVPGRTRPRLPGCSGTMRRRAGRR